ncbi:MAG TPA: ferritin-like domain-containing protein, partial [Minicystis sp.]|nr:ferritin-like domain-containing protein [Minicystis sp.]
APPAIDTTGFTAEEVAFAAASWTLRAEEEHRSASVFADALAYLTDADVPLDAVGSLARTVSDELAHTELCALLARAFGAAEPANRPLPRAAVPSDPVARRARGLEIVAMEGAVGETISSAVFLTAQRHAEEPATRTALGAILRDEVLHARMSWEILGVVAPTLDDAAREALRTHVSWGLGALEQSHMLPVLKRLERGDRFEPAWAALGVVHPEHRVNAFYGALEKRVLPSLDGLGLDGQGAWRDRYASRAPRPPV